MPTDATGLFALRAQLGASVARARVTAEARSLSYGSTGPDVIALRARLRSCTSTSRPRPRPSAPSSTTASSPSRRPAGSSGRARSTPRPGGRSPRTSCRRRATTARHPHRGLEEPADPDARERRRDAWYLPVSSGAGGITPVGNYRILWKAPSTTTWLGSAILYRTMTFHANSPSTASRRCRPTRRATAASGSRSGSPTGCTSSRRSASGLRLRVARPRPRRRPAARPRRAAAGRPSARARRRAAPVDDRRALGLRLLEQPVAVLEREPGVEHERRRTAATDTGVERGSSPAATTRSTSESGVTTPTSAPASSTTSTTRTSGRTRCSAASCALDTAGIAAGSESMPSRTRLICVSSYG